MGDRVNRSVTKASSSFLKNQLHGEVSFIPTMYILYSGTHHVIIGTAFPRQQLCVHALLIPATIIYECQY